MAIEGLGRVINMVPVAAGQSISLKNNQGVTFVVYGTSEVFTLQSSAVAGSGQANLAIITRYQQSTATNGTAAWTEQTQAAAATITPPAGDMVAFYVDANDLPAGNKYVNVNHTSTGLVLAVLHDPLVQRDPANLVAVGV